MSLKRVCQRGCGVERSKFCEIPLVDNDLWHSPFLLVLESCEFLSSSLSSCSNFMPGLWSGFLNSGVTCRDNNLQDFKASLEALEGRATGK